MFPEGTPEQRLLETLLGIEEKPASQRTVEETEQIAVLDAWFSEGCRIWGCRRLDDVRTVADRDHTVQVIRAARFGFVLARVPKERAQCYAFDYMERYFFRRAKEQIW